MEYLTTDKEGIKILIEVLKEKGIRQVVLSPGFQKCSFVGCICP